MQENTTLNALVMRRARDLLADYGCMTHGCTLVNVYITDMKTVHIPQK